MFHNLLFCQALTKLPPLTLTPPMNPHSEFKALKDWKNLELNSLTLTLTPASAIGSHWI
jgi:hypothetical protein